MTEKQKQVLTRARELLSLGEIIDEDIIALIEVATAMEEEIKRLVLQSRPVGINQIIRIQEHESMIPKEQGRPRHEC